MKITIDIQPLLHERSGVGHYVYNIVRELILRDKFNTYFLTYFSFLNEWKNPPFAGNNVIINRRRFIPGRLLAKYWQWMDWPGYDTLSGPSDIFHFPNFLARPVGAARTLATIHDVSFKRFPEYTEPKNLKYLTRCLNHTLERSDSILADSDFTKREIVECYGYPEDKISVAHLGVADYFKPVKDLSGLESLKKRYKLAQPYILYLGTIEPRKNLGTLFRAFQLLKHDKKYARLKLVLAGGRGWLLEKVYEPLRASGIQKDVLFTGYVPDEDLPGLLSLAELFVFPSVYEGFGLPPLEAMACGVPVVSSEAGSLKEILGNAAVYFNSSSAGELKEKMAWILEDHNKKEQLVKAGFEHVKNFSWEKTAAKILAVYNRLAEKT